MWRQTTLTVLLGIALPLAAQEMVAEEPDCVEVPVDPRPDCIEAVVLARFLEYRPGPIAHEPDVIVLSWTWDVDIAARKVYLGGIQPGRLTIGATLHTEFNRQLRHPVLFLTRKFDRWYLAYVEWGARDDRGDIVLPMFGPPSADDLSPAGWLPQDWERWLRPIRYRAGDMGDLWQIHEDSPDREDEWVRVRKGHATAKRGFRLKDVEAMLAERRAVECAREEPDDATVARR